MEILRSNIEACAGLTGAVVIIDVLRSFTTAAYAFAANARAIYPAPTIAAARALRASRAPRRGPRSAGPSKSAPLLSCIEAGSSGRRPR